MKQINILKFLFIMIILQSHISFLYGTTINTASNNSQLLQHALPSMLTEEDLDTLITIENPHFKSVVAFVIENALEQGIDNLLSDGLLRCYIQLCKNNNTFLARDLIDALPNIMIQLNQMKTKAPRPSLPNPVVGPEACNVSIVENLLNEILRNLTTCCNNAAIDFSGTYSAIQDIKNTLTACCNNILSDFQQTWTILAADFNGTFSLLEELDGDLNNCCNIMLAKLATIESEVTTLETAINSIEIDVNTISALISESATIFDEITAAFNICCNTIEGINNTANHVSCLAACIAVLCEPVC